jgi:hypothetical protein
LRQILIGSALLVLLAIAVLPAIQTLQWFDFALNSGIGDIKFYGKVVNQYGKPLPNAKIHYNAIGKFYATGSGPGHVFSDSRGKFIIDVHGSAIDIINIDYPNAMYVAITEEADGGGEMYHKGNIFWGFQKSGRSKNLVWKDYNQKIPFVFDVWVVDQAEAKLQKSNVSWNRSEINIAPDGSPFTVVLTTVKRQIQYFPGTRQDGDLIVNCERESMTVPRDRSDWKITLRPVKGGIQKTADRYLNQAPQTGYLSSVDISRKFGNQNFQAEVHNQRYYFTAQNGEVYGTLFIDFKPFRLSNKSGDNAEVEQYCRLYIEYKVNREGDRNLFKNRRNLLSD